MQLESLNDNFGVGCARAAGQWTRLISCENTSFMDVPLARCVRQYVRGGQYNVYIFMDRRDGALNGSSQM